MYIVLSVTIKKINKKIQQKLVPQEIKKRAYTHSHLYIRETCKHALVDSLNESTHSSNYLTREAKVTM